MISVVVRHPPWVGDLFAHSSTRLMVLGESHHSDRPDATDMTIGVVESWLSANTNPAFRFFTHLAVALSGKEPSDLNRREVFRRIMFYNYVQAVMNESRVAPTREQFSDSESAFRMVIEEHNPTHIIACGERLWEHMPYFDSPNKEGNWVTLGDEKKFYIGYYRTGSAQALAMCMRHPQAGFNGRKWYPRIQAFLDMSPATVQ